MDLLRFITAGNVDDGKSTLIGRLLYDSKSILTDQLEAIERQTKHKGKGELDLALLTDGLRAEREQGITIDVAYRYFNTAKRKFIIADAPGHIQYTRNMITGASNSELIIILIDARQGVTEQTRRHSIIASLLRMPHVLVAVNKMDLCDYAQDVFLDIVQEYSQTAAALGLKQVTYLPVSALNGDNIVSASDNMAWYTGKPLLDLLETVSVTEQEAGAAARFPVQYVIRPQRDDLPDYRGYAGKITSGNYQVNDPVTVFPSGIQTHIKAIELGGKLLQEAHSPQSVIIHLADDVDVSRGDLIVKRHEAPRFEQEQQALICWLDQKPMEVGKRYILRHNTCSTPAVIRETAYLLNVNTLQQEPAPAKIQLNEFVKATIKTALPLAFDTYAAIRANGTAILIDETSHATVAAVLFED